MALFARIRDMAYPVFLDSGLPGHGQGQYDIICADPVCTLTSEHGITRTQHSSGRKEQSTASPFQILKQTLTQYQFDAQGHADLPFKGGAVGYFSYDLGRYLENLPVVGERDIDFPEMQVGIYLWALVVDHKNKRIELIAAPTLDSAYIEQILKRLTKGPEAPINHPFSLNAPFKSNMNSASYSERFSRIIDYIKAGDCYQVNLAQRFSAPCQGDSWEAYQALRIKAPTPFSAYLTTPFGNLLCLSPERFIQVKNGRVETKPIKGTRPRGDSAENDETLRIELLQSTKDRAENLMIVDLLRNDLGKTCAIGSVKVPKLFDIESYANVHHMVTTITGELKNTEDAVDLLEGSFPGGSITGAPKLRAMEIIEELEPQRRSAYCGSIGYIDFSGRMDTNICIRTLVEKDQQLHCWAGGGIVADSQCADEYQETFTKVNNLIRTLEDQFGHSQ